MHEFRSARGGAGALIRSGRLTALTLALLASSAHAKTLSAMAPQSPTAPKASSTATDDGLAGGGFYLEADTLTRNETSRKVSARGAVEVRYKGRVLRADRVDYDPGTGVVLAQGKVRIIQSDGTAEFADSISLDKTLSEGFATGFAARLQGHVQIAAASGERRGDQVTELRRVIYTPCLACMAHGPKRPTWSIKARSVVEDKKHKRLVFRHAMVQVLGQDVLYLPVLEAADPTADHRSGLLVPMLTFTGPRGVSYEQPYYQRLTPSQDLLITPQINSRVRPFLNLDWRKRFYSGELEVRAGYTYDRDFTSSGQRFGDDTSRSYILANGAFQIDKAWTWGFTAERASERLIFQKYSVGDVFANNTTGDRGLYAADDQRLISQIYAVRQNSNSYLSIAAISVQGLRTTDLQGTFPTIAPLIEARWEAPGAVLGGRLRLQGSAVALTRDQSLSTTDVTGQALIPGVDSRRATAQADWRRSFTLSDGLRIQPFLTGRIDLFSVADTPPNSSSSTIARGFGSLGANVSYPLVKVSPGVTWILEPLAQVSIAPNTRQDARIPNEDSVDFSFDETNLFQTNRSPGYDLYEGGQSVTLAGRASAILDDGRSASLVLGRRIAAQSDPTIPALTGLSRPLSDWILGADATPIKGVRLYTRLRLDGGTFTVNTLEAGADFSTSRAEGSVSYLQERNSPFGGRVTSLDIHGALYATPHWGVTSYLIVDGGAWRRTEIGAVYRDDCLRVEVIWRHDETFNGALGPSTSVLIRLKLATLGNTR